AHKKTHNGLDRRRHRRQIWLRAANDCMCFHREDFTLKRMIGFPWRFAIIAMAVASTAHAHAAAWQPPAGGEQIALWRDPAVVARPEAKGEESASTAKSPVAGRTWTKIENVVRPTMTVFPAKDANTGAAIVVFQAAATT